MRVGSLGTWAHSWLPCWCWIQDSPTVGWSCNDGLHPPPPPQECTQHNALHTMEISTFILRLLLLFHISNLFFSFYFHSFFGLFIDLNDIFHRLRAFRRKGLSMSFKEKKNKSSSPVTAWEGYSRYNCRRKEEDTLSRAFEAKNNGCLKRYDIPAIFSYSQRQEKKKLTGYSWTFNRDAVIVTTIQTLNRDPCYVLVERSSRQI